MALLDATSRQRVWAQAMRDIPRDVGLPEITKQELKAAMDAMDDWIEAQQLTFNLALPQPFRAAATGRQKSVLFMMVLARRAGLHWAQEDS